MTHNIADEFPIDMWSDDDYDEPSYGASKKKNKKGTRKFILLDSNLKDTKHVFTGSSPSSAARKAATKNNQKVVLREHKGVVVKDGFRIFTYKVTFKKEKVGPVEMVGKRSKKREMHPVLDANGNALRYVPTWAVKRNADHEVGYRGSKREKVHAEGPAAFGR